MTPEANLTEKMPAAPPVAQINTKASHETMTSSQTLTPAQEKPRTTTDAPRASDVSSPASNHLNPFDTDIEAIITPTSTTGDGLGRKSMCTKGGSDCHVWPGQEHWKNKHKAAKAKRGCSCLSRLSKRNRLIARILIVVLVVAIGVGVGFGISKPLGASIWTKPS